METELENECRAENDESVYEGEANLNFSKGICIKLSFHESHKRPKNCL